MPKMILVAILALMANLASIHAQSKGGALKDKLQGLISTTNSPAAALGVDQIAAGLKEALAKGTETAVRQLGATNGYLGDALVKIPMPSELKQVDATLRKLKQDHLADEFITTMNRAAEQAVPLAAPVFAEAVKQMTIADAKAILNGPKDAATQYFSRVTRETLLEKFTPLVKQTTDKVGLTSAYKQMTDRAKFLSPFTKTKVMDLDGYVTDKALDGLFLILAQEEAKIRQDPAARTTDLLKKVFGSAK